MIVIEVNTRKLTMQKCRIIDAWCEKYWEEKTFRTAESEKPGYLQCIFTNDEDALAFKILFGIE